MRTVLSMSKLFVEGDSILIAGKKTISKTKAIITLIERCGARVYALPHNAAHPVLFSLRKNGQYHQYGRDAVNGALLYKMSGHPLRREDVFEVVAA